MTRRRLARVAAVSVLVLSGCGGGAGERPVCLVSSSLFPADTLRDWVSYADHVAVYRVVGERALRSRDTYIPREVTLRIERRLWSARRAPPLPSEVRMGTGIGWTLRDGERERQEPDDGPRLAVGERYLSPLALVEFEVGPEWWPLSYEAQIPVDGATVGQATWNPCTTDELSGRSVSEARRAIRTTPPDPIAATFAHLRPQDRIEAVMRKRNP